MVNSKNTSYKTACTDVVTNQTGCGVYTQLEDHSTVTATKTIVRTVVWNGISDPTRVIFSNTSATESISTYLVFVPDLVNKNISVIFMPEKV